jgi:integrase
MARPIQAGKPERIGLVSLLCFKTDKGRRYYARWWDQSKGRAVEESLRTASRDEARKLAKDKDATLRAFQGLPVAVREHLDTAPELAAALQEAIKARRRAKGLSDGQTVNLGRFAQYWLDFMAGEFPSVRLWKDVRRRPHVTAYAEFLEGRGLSPVSVRHYLEPLSIASTYFSEEYEEIYRPLKVLRAAPLPKDEPAKHFLDAVRLDAAIARAEAENSPRAALGFMLGGWGGLNLREVIRLRADSFDFKAGTVRIEESKNRFRKRVVPLPSFVVDHVRAFIAGQAVRDASGLLILPPEGGEPHDRHLYKPMKRILGLCAKAEAEERRKAGIEDSDGWRSPYAEVAPKDCRKAFVNIAVAAGVERETLRRFIGHVPADVLSGHYEAFTAERFRAEVVGKVEALRAGLQGGAATGSRVQLRENYGNPCAPLTAEA